MIARAQQKVSDLVRQRTAQHTQHLIAKGAAWHVVGESHDATIAGDCIRYMVIAGSGTPSVNPESTRARHPASWSGLAVKVTVSPTALPPPPYRPRRADGDRIGGLMRRPPSPPTPRSSETPATVEDDPTRGGGTASDAAIRSRADVEADRVDQKPRAEEIPS